WPLGDGLTPRVVALQGWSYVLIGAASTLLFVLLLFLPGMLAKEDPVILRWVVGVVLAIAVGLALAATVPYVRSVRMSRR
ncbi:MAG TPA: hypothetical protein VGG90_09325, partial [Candidatus Dormibacteraeota bacterium]